MRIRDIEEPGEHDLVKVAALLATTFADPNTVLGLDRLREFLASNRPGAARQFHVLVAHEATSAGTNVKMTAPPGLVRMMNSGS